ncbi:hypothetical protein [Synechococcus sp. MIT S9452]|uniref:hypothetical protein n=1 Tax=Synechococcus sp. MIT S9452 TaxID=3082546 RepID=UPI0039A429B5
MATKKTTELQTMKVLSALACASLLAVSMAAPAVAGVKVKNSNGGSVNVNRGGVKVQGGGGSKVKVNPGRNGSVNMKGPNGRGGSVSW